jgi:hypothetical protein
VAWVTRRSYALAATALLAVAAGVAAIVVLVADSLEGGGRARTLTRKEYLARIQVICHSYDQKLARIPPGASVQLLAQSIGQALPLVERRIAEQRSVEPPPELAARVEHAFALADEVVRDLKESRRKALAGDAGGSVTAFAKFIQAADKARQAEDAIGFRC